MIVLLKALKKKLPKAPKPPKPIVIADDSTEDDTLNA